MSLAMVAGLNPHTRAGRHNARGHDPHFALARVFELPAANVRNGLSAGRSGGPCVGLTPLITWHRRAV